MSAIGDWTSVEAHAGFLANSAFFDPAWYLNEYPDVAASGMDPLVHYLAFGAREGRDPGPFFSTKTYLAQRPDAGDAGLNPLVHFLRFGIMDIARAEPRATIQACLDLGVRVQDQPSVAPVAPRRPKTGPKAVFVSHDANIGGAPAVLASIAAWFQRHTDYDVRVVCMGGGPWLARFEAVAPTFHVGHLEVPADSVQAVQEGLRTFIGDEPAFVFINSAAAGGYCSVDPFNAPVICYVHELARTLENFERPFRTLMARADHVICDGTSVHATLRRLTDLDEDRFSVRPAFIETPTDARVLSSADKSRIRRELGWPAESKVVMGCGVVHWRKQPDLFIRLAQRLLPDNEDALFVWIGGGPDLDEMKARIADLKLGDKVRFIGHRDDFRHLLKAADIFALTSVEDPFPLVCLEAAAASAPSVVFRETTGMTVLVEPEGGPQGGLAVPEGDEGAYVDAVGTLLRDNKLRERLGRTAFERVHAQFTADAGCAEILRTVRRVANLRPRVSVVVPNYNCGPYLNQRLQSVADQTFKDYEILLLDDKSVDESQAILSEFADANPDARLMLADANSGSAFKAWERGITAATGDLVWIAEADDWCEPTFLERAVAAFATAGVRLVHGRSIPVDKDGKVAGDWNDLYLDRIAPGRWRRSFCEPAAKAVNAALGRANTIPNASAVVVLRDSALRAVRAATEFKLAGDWAFYVSAIAGGRIAYCHEAVNYHRRHDTTVTSKVEGKPAYYQELADVGALIRQIYGPNTERDDSFREFLRQEAARFGFLSDMPEGEVPAELRAPRVPGILFGVGDLSGGGAQMFAVRFVNGWTKLPASAVLFITGHEPDHRATRARLSPEVPVIRHDEIQAVGLKQFMADWGLDLVVTGHWWADSFIASRFEQEGKTLPWVVVMHGCYENVLSNWDAFPDARDAFARAGQFCDHWVWLAPKNRQVFEEGHIAPGREKNIVTGYEPVPLAGLKRNDIGIPEDALVFTLVSRAIEEKGWGVAVEAFRQLRAEGTQGRDVRLVLIGDGPVADSLRPGAQHEGVHLVRHTTRVADYMHLSDVCLLPSWFSGESLPLVLIEFLAHGKPAVVSDIGMSPWAIDAEGGGSPAGVVVGRNGEGGAVTPQDLKAAMRRFVDDPGLSAALAPAAHRAFAKFDFQRMLTEYRQVFEDVLRAQRPDS